MSDQTLLSSLCSVCNINESKYKCPGCSARTCSLPCVKRHKQWAQCSGKRDPTKFVKKSELATPAGIDHDYNFLSGIERDLEKSDKSVAEKGLEVGLSSRSRGEPSQKMDYHFASAGVRVIRAPKGMSRAKDNQTHRSKSGNKNIIWTVEWIGADQGRTLTQNSAAEPLYRIHPLFESPTSKKKRKRDAEAALNSDLQSIAEPTARPTSSSGADPKVNVPEAASSPSTLQKAPDQDTAILDPHNSISDPAASGPPTDTRYVFYLLRPRTSSSRRVLIPLASTDTLGDALRGHTVEEFPTIYYFTTAMPKLPLEFMLDEAYRKEDGERQKEFEELMKDVSPELLRKLKDDGTNSRVDEEVDSKRILDVLKQDLSSL